jgi:chromosome partitioning protein
MIIALCGQKGGSGKSTVAIAVAAELAARGRSVLLVDADEQGTTRTWAATATAAGFDTVTCVAMGADLHRPGQVPKLAPNFDVTVIDTPPRSGATQRAALAVANVAIIPCGPSTGDIWALAESVTLVKEAMTLRPNLRAAVLITKRQASTAMGQSAREALDGCGLPVLRSELGLRVAYAEAMAAGQGVGQYSPNNPAAAEVVALVDEIETLGKRGKHGKA